MISINLINYNNGDCFDEFSGALYEMVSLLDYDYEIVLVDNYSDDGSYEKLKEITDIHCQMESTRGEARNKCLELCSGDVTVDQIDTDQEPQPVLADIINWYCDNMPEWCLNTNGCMINNANTVKGLKFGDHQSGEDKCLWDKLIDRGLYKHIQINTCHHIDNDHKRSPPFYHAHNPFPQSHRKNEYDQLRKKFTRN